MAPRRGDVHIHGSVLGVPHVQGVLLHVAALCGAGSHTNSGSSPGSHVTNRGNLEPVTSPSAGRLTEVMDVIR